jgi:hypothetical protein
MVLKLELEFLDPPDTQDVVRLDVSEFELEFLDPLCSFSGGLGENPVHGLEL